MKSQPAVWLRLWLLAQRVRQTSVLMEIDFPRVLLVELRRNHGKLGAWSLLRPLHQQRTSPCELFTIVSQNCAGIIGTACWLRRSMGFGSPELCASCSLKFSWFQSERHVKLCLATPPHFQRAWIGGTLCLAVPQHSTFSKKKVRLRQHQVRAREL